MIHKVIMPKLGESVTEGTIVKWLVKPGDTVKQYDSILEVETDKVVADVPATEGGVVKDILFKEGETVSVGTLICTIDVGTSTNVLDKEENLKSDSSSNYTTKSNIHEISSSTNSDSVVPLNVNKSSVRYSPAVLSLAQEYNIDLTQVQSSGFEGRVTRKDVLSYVSRLNKVASDSKITNTYNDTNQELSGTTDLSNGDKLIPVSAVRKAIAKKMVQSVHSIPHAWLTIEVDATELVSLRNKMKSEFLSKEGFSITYFAFFVVEVVKVLRKFPLLNSVWQESNIILKKDINISIAVAIENNLFVPVIKSADSKNVTGIAKEIYELVNKAKNNSLTPDDMQGGTFTINNTGSFGSVYSMGIINYPQAAILQIESISKKPVVIQNSMIAIRDMVNLSLSIDHRIIDGLLAGNFLKQVKYNIENINKTSV